MTLSLHTIQAAPGSKKSRKKIGRGGKRGTYSGKGLKGQHARSGTSGFKRRGMKPLIEQTKKLRGFKSRQTKPAIVNLDTLNKNFKAGTQVNPETLEKNGLVKKINSGIKILGSGEINVKIEVQRCEVSDTARQKIEAAGGQVK